MYFNSHRFDWVKSDLSASVKKLQELSEAEKGRKEVTKVGQVKETTLDQVEFPELNSLKKDCGNKVYKELKNVGQNSKVTNNLGQVSREVRNVGQGMIPYLGGYSQGGVFDGEEGGEGWTGQEGGDDYDYEKV